MKFIYLLFFIFFAHFAKAQIDAGFSYNLSIPRKEMSHNIKPIHALYLSGGYSLPGRLSNISVGANIGLGTYANLTKETTFSFNNGNPTTTDVHYMSDVFVSSINAKVDVAKNLLVTPYAKVEGGIQKFYSTIRIDDPNDIDGCRPLEKKSILKDITGFYGLGAGVKLDMRIFSKNFLRKEQWIDISVSTINGGELDYVNTRKLKDAHEHDMSEDEPQPEVPGKTRPLNLKFINVSSNIIHEHKVAEVYTTKLKLFDIRIAYHISF